MANDFLLDNEDDLLIEDGDFVIGESTMQDVGIILKAVPGEIKNDPILGAALFAKVKSGASQLEIEAIVKKHLKRDGKDYNTVKNNINIKRNLL